MDEPKFKVNQKVYCVLLKNNSYSPIEFTISSINCSRSIDKFSDETIITYYGYQLSNECFVTYTSHTEMNLFNTIDEAQEKANIKNKMLQAN